MALNPIAPTSTSGAQVRAAYNASNYTDVTTDASGNVTITPSGGAATIAGSVAISGALTAVTSITMTQTAASNRTIFGTRTDAQVTIGGGTSANGGSIQLFGSAYTNFAGAIYYDAYTTGAGTNDGDHIWRVNGGTEKMRLSHEGLLSLVGDLDVGGDLDITGATTLAGGLVSYGANDSAGAGFRTVRVPNV